LYWSDSAFQNELNRSDPPSGGSADPLACGTFDPAAADPVAADPTAADPAVTDPDPILQNTIFPILHTFVRILVYLITKIVKYESYQIFVNICKPSLAHFTSILQKTDSK
jgi:hypothetical protein